MKTHQPDAPRFNIGDVVYHKVREQPGLVTAIIWRDRYVNYEVSWEYGGQEEHQGIELSTDRCYHVPGTAAR